MFNELSLARAIFNDGGTVTNGDPSHPESGIDE